MYMSLDRGQCKVRWRHDNMLRLSLALGLIDMLRGAGVDREDIVAFVRAVVRNGTVHDLKWHFETVAVAYRHRDDDTVRRWVERWL